MKIQHLIALTCALAAASACTKKETAPEGAAAPSANTAAAPAAAPAASAAPAAAGETLDASKATATLEIGSDGDAMAFDKKELSAKPGEIVKLTFKNNSKSSALQHNWVLTQPGKESEVDQAGIAAGAEKGWIPAGHPAIIAHTKLVDPGQSDTIVFRTPAAGDYPFICIFPGHSAAMRGTLHVK